LILLPTVHYWSCRWRCRIDSVSYCAILRVRVSTFLPCSIFSSCDNLVLIMFMT